MNSKNQISRLFHWSLPILLVLSITMVGFGRNSTPIQIEPNAVAGLNILVGPGNSYYQLGTGFADLNTYLTSEGHTVTQQPTNITGNHLIT